MNPSQPSVPLISSGRRAEFLGHANGSDADVAAVLEIVESYWDNGGRAARPAPWCRF
jgi:hypothetical protein